MQTSSKKTTEIFILKMLSIKSMTAAEVTKNLSEVTEGEDPIHSGAVWTTLSRMITSGKASTSSIGDTNAVKLYNITPEGKSYLADYLNTLNKIDLVLS